MGALRGSRQRRHSHRPAARRLTSFRVEASWGGACISFGVSPLQDKIPIGSNPRRCRMLVRNMAVPLFQKRKVASIWKEVTARTSGSSNSASHQFICCSNTHDDSVNLCEAWSWLFFCLPLWDGNIHIGIHIYIYIHICVYVYIYIYTYTYVCAYLYIYISIYLSISLSLSIYIYIYM